MWLKHFYLSINDNEIIHEIILRCCIDLFSQKVLFMMHIHPKQRLQVSSSLSGSSSFSPSSSSTSCSGATTLPPLPFYPFQSPSHPPSLPVSLLLSLSPSAPPLSLSSISPLEKKSSSCFFSLKRAEANWILAGLQLSGLWLQAGGGRRRRRDGTREAGKKVEGRAGRKKLLRWDIF